MGRHADHAVAPRNVSPPSTEVTGWPLRGVLVAAATALRSLPRCWFSGQAEFADGLHGRMSLAPGMQGSWEVLNVGLPQVGEISVFIALKVLLRVRGTSGRWQKTPEGAEHEVTSEMDCLHHQNVPLSQEFHAKALTSDLCSEQFP